MASFFKEFKEFAMRGNVIDLAVGVVVGGAFGKIVTSLVDNIIMPPIGLLVGKVDFSSLQLVLREDDPATKANELVAIKYGLFANTLIQFIIVAFAIFLMIRAINALKRPAADAAPAEPAGPTPTEVLLAEIRDELRKKG